MGCLARNRHPFSMSSASGLNPQAAPTEKIPAAAAVCISTPESPTRRQCFVSVFSSATILNAPAGSGFLRNRLLTPMTFSNVHAASSLSTYCRANSCGLLDRTNSLPGQTSQQFRNTGIGGCCSIPGLGVCQHGFLNTGFQPVTGDCGFRKGPPHQHLPTVADKRPIPVHWMRGVSSGGQHPVHRIPDILQGVQQGTVHIKNDRLDAPRSFQ